MKSYYLDQLIASRQYMYTSTDEIIASYFSTLGSDIIYMTIRELAENIPTSETSVFKFVNKLGFKSFKEFKLNVALEQEKRPMESNAYVSLGIEDISPTDNEVTIAKKVFCANSYSMNEFLPNLENIPFDKICQVINKAEHIFFFGIGGSSVIAYDAYHKFIRIKQNVFFNTDYHISMSIASHLTSQDCSLLFSHSGTTKEPINVAQTLKSHGVSIISLTGNKESELVKLSDFSIIIPSKELYFRTEALTSRILYLSIIDVIYTILMRQNINGNLKILKK